MLLFTCNGIAQIVTMNDGGSTATIDLGSSAGMNSWSVLGQNQLNQQWFWYRTDGGVANPINSIGGLTYTTSSGPDGINVVDATYQNAQLSIEIQYILSGGGVGSGNADLTETIMAMNLNSSGSLDLNFYEYSNFNLLQSGNNSVTVFGAPGAYSYVTQTSGSTALTEAIISPSANYAETATFNQTLNELNTVSRLGAERQFLGGAGQCDLGFPMGANHCRRGSARHFQRQELVHRNGSRAGDRGVHRLGGWCAGIGTPAQVGLKKIFVGFRLAAKGPVSDRPFLFCWH